MLRDQNQLVIDELFEELRILKPAPSPVRDVVRFKSAVVRDGDKMWRETFVNQDFHRRRASGSSLYGCELGSPRRLARTTATRMRVREGERRSNLVGAKRMIVL